MYRKLLLLILTVSLVFLCIFPVSAIAQSSEDIKVYCSATLEDEFADDKLLIVLNKTATAQNRVYNTLDFPEISCNDVENLFTNSAAENPNFRQILQITLSVKSKENVLDTIHILEDRGDIEYVGPDYIGTLASLPNDEYNTSQWAVEKIQLDDVWDNYYYGNEIRVGIIDSGIDGNHPDLSDRIDTGMCRDFSTGSTLFTGTPSDTFGHGTHVAGIIAAKRGNSIGIAGICHWIKLVSLKTTINYSNEYFLSNFARAVNYAETAGIPILNISMSFSVDDYTIRTALGNYSGIAICSAGNDTKDIDNSPKYPACYTYDNIITVGNSNSLDMQSVDSNFGAQSVDLFAPGTNIISCFPVGLCQYPNSYLSHSNGTHLSNGYHSLSGTSMAAPFVTGVVAVIKSKCPNMTNAQIKSVILNTVDILPGFNALCVSGGRLNAYNAITAAINGNY